jgi:gas vesicle protein
MGNFLLGLGIGITAGVLLAPKSGSETRKYIADKAAEGTDYVTDQGRQLKDTASDLYDRGRNIVNSQFQRA